MSRRTDVHLGAPLDGFDGDCDLNGECDFDCECDYDDNPGDPDSRKAVSVFDDVNGGACGCGGV